jgi:hypothetical protein
MQIGLLEHGKPESLFVSEVMIQHSLVDTGALRNFVDPRAGKTFRGELGGRRTQDATARDDRLAALAQCRSVSSGARVDNFPGAP